MTLNATDVTIRFGGVMAVNQMEILVQPGEIVGLDRTERRREDHLH